MTNPTPTRRELIAAWDAIKTRRGTYEGLSPDETAGEVLARGNSRALITINILPHHAETSYWNIVLRLYDGAILMENSIPAGF